MVGDHTSSLGSHKVSTKILQPVHHIGVIHEPHDSGVDRSVLHQHHGVGRGFSEEKVFSVLLVDHDTIFHFW